MAAPKKAEQEKFRKLWAKVVARAWSDDLFKQKLLNHPAEALKEYGLAIPAGTNLKVLEETPKASYLILPKKPKGELSIDELKSVAAGAFEATIAVQCVSYRE